MSVVLTVLAMMTPVQGVVEAPVCSRACRQRVQRKQLRRKKRRVVRPYRAWITRVAECESGGDWSINTGNSFYGGMQFTLGSWKAVGGRGMPHEASRLEQSYRAVRLLKVQGPGAWPVCSR